MATILVVEDDDHVRILAESILRTHGFETLSADEPARAFAILKHPDLQIDLLFTDIGMRNAKHGGLDLAQEAVRLRPGLRVLYASGRTLTDAMNGRFIRGSGFLPKPYTSDALICNVRSLLSKPLRAA